MKIKNKKRFIIGNSVVLGIAVGICILLNNTTFSYSAIEYQKIYIDSGDTLWGIAERISQENNTLRGKDIRDIIQNIKMKNQLKDSQLTIGQELWIPR